MDIIYFLIISSVAYSIGRRFFLNFLRFEISLNSIEYFVVSSVFGFAIISHLIMVLGIFGVLRKDVLVWSFLILFIVCIADIYKLLRKLFFFLLKISENKLSPLEKSLVVILFLVSLFVLLVGTAPLTGSDALQTYFSIPKMYANANSIFPTYWSDVAFKMTVPHHLTLLGLVLSSQELSLGINVFGGFLSVLAIYILSSRMLSRQHSLFLVLFFICTPMIFWQIFSGSGDIWTVVCFVLSLHFYMNWLERDQENFLYLAAFLSGIAASVKYTLLISPLILCFFFIGHYLIKARSVNGLFLRFLKFSFFVFLGAFPPFLRNLFWSGDPIYPLFTKLFHAGSYSRDFVDIGSAGGYSSSFSDLFLFPFKMILDGEKYGDGHFFGIIILSFLPLIFLFHFKGKAKFLLSFSIVFFVLIFYAAQLARYLLPIFPILLILSVSSLISFCKGNILKNFYWGVLIFSFLFNLSTMVLYYGDSLPVSIGLEAKQSFLERKSPDYKIVKFVNSVVPKNGKILLSEGLHHRFYLNAKNEVYHHKYFWANFNRKVPFDSGKEFLRSLRSKGFTHIATHDRPGLNWSHWGIASQLMGRLEKCCVRFLSSEEFMKLVGSKRFRNNEKIIVSIYELRE